MLFRSSGREERVQHSRHNTQAGTHSDAGQGTRAAAQARPEGTKPNPDIAPPDLDTAAIGTRNRLQNRSLFNSYSSCEPLPKSKSTESGSVQLIEPRSGKMADLFHNVFALLLHEGKHERL